MILRDLSYWSLVKLTLFLTLLIPLIGVLIVIPMALLDVPNVTLSLTSEGTPKMFNMIGLKMPGIPKWITVLLVYILNLLVGCKVLQLIARYTPLGRIRIGIRSTSQS